MTNDTAGIALVVTGVILIFFGLWFLFVLRSAHRRRKSSAIRVTEKDLAKAKAMGAGVRPAVTRSEERLPAEPLPDLFTELSMIRTMLTVLTTEVRSVRQALDAHVARDAEQLRHVS
jgi:hypothetical protein